MREDIYFCLDLTESEHEIISSELSEVCATNGLELVYYRKLKEGHIPMIREIKVRFHGKRPIFFRFMSDKNLWNHAKRWENGKPTNWVPYTGTSF